MAVAERVSEERSEKLGGIVGYQIRLESVMVSLCWHHASILHDVQIYKSQEVPFFSLKLISSISCTGS
jgi:hypothetical protein